MKILNISKQVSTKDLLGTKGIALKDRVSTSAMRYLWRVHVQGCLRRDVMNHITIGDYEQYSKQNCSYCGQPPFNMTKLKKGINILYNGVDRVDNTKPYEIGNIVTCCKYCNAMKSKLGVDLFLQHVQRIATYQLQLALD